MDEIKKIKAEIVEMLELVCSMRDLKSEDVMVKVDMIEKLSASYNNICQAQKSQVVPTLEIGKDGRIISSYGEPTRSNTGI